MLVLRAPDQAHAVPHSQVRALALNRLEALAAEDMLEGDTPSAVIVVQAVDSAADLSRELGFDVLAGRCAGPRFDEEGYAPTFEVIEEHQTVFELVFVFSDYGDGAIVLVPKEEGMDADLLALCSMHAVPAREALP